MLIRIIEHYLEGHKRLVVPQLGAFLVKEEPRVVVFSELLRRDDGVLQGLLVSEGMSEVAARGEIDRLVYEVRHAIEAGERYYLSDFGEFYPGKQGTILFEYHPRLSYVSEAPIDVIPDLIEKVRPEVRHAEPKVADVVEQRPLEPQQPVWTNVVEAGPDDEEDVVEIAEDELLEGVESKPKVSLFEDADEVEEHEEHEEREEEEVKPEKERRPRPHGPSPRNRRPVPQQQKKPDYFLWVAISAGVIALLAIAFGLYNDAMSGGEEPMTEEYEYVEPLIETAAQSDPYGVMNE